MVYIVGPFDKRRLRTRCAACRVLHLKCEGGHPCRSCMSAGCPCKFEAAVRQPIRFRSSAYHNSNFILHPSIFGTDQDDNCIWHFFSSFLPRNDFTARPSNEQQILKSYIYKSAGLRAAVIAIGALDLSRHTDYSLKATARYRQAISSLREQLTSGVNIDDVTLWISLLLAIFELMSDTTGQGFMLHFTKGLPALLRQRNFTPDETNCRQTLLHTIQMLEAMRSAPFWRNKESTLLEDQRWQQVTQHTTGESSETRSFTVLYNLMSHFLKFNNMVSATVLTMAPEDMTLGDRQQLRWAAEDGQHLSYQLEMWYIRHVHCTGTQTPLSLISKIYHRALVISMSAMFNFAHFAYCRLSVPSSSASTMSTKVDELCTLLRCALRTTNLAGTSILWPLRVAGSNSIRKGQAQQVLEMLREIRQRGFAVAQSFEEVLIEQWKRRFLL